MTGLQRESIDFGGLEIAFDERVLRPRTWTENQSWWAAELLPDLPPGDVLELCSGAGQIGLLAVAGTDRRLVCVDLNPAAAELTTANAAAAGRADLVEVREGRISDVLAPGERFPMMIADPPWVRRADTQRFPEDPLLAIDGGDDGLTVVRECLTAIATHLAEGGVALLQLGPGDQAEQVSRLLAGTPLVPGESRAYGDRGVLLRIDR
ncbi:MAG: methyltransferase [Marmoricola sp.]|jgi:methylase of polypeptide subunit release factors|nr:methyltransferase [Marmoricola sp.]